MTQAKPSVNNPAALTNVALLWSAVEKAINDCRYLGGLFLAFYGHAGYGKTCACTFVGNKTKAVRVECFKHWNKKALLQAILSEIVVPSERTISDMFNRIVFELQAQDRPLILDEADHLAKDSMIEIVRNIMDSAKVPVVLCGEENLVKKLERWPRVHSRILEPVQALPADMDDVAKLAGMYCQSVKISEEWLRELHQQTGGNTRRIAINLNRARNEAEHLEEITLKTWGDRGWFTGKTPSLRKPV